MKQILAKSHFFPQFGQNQHWMQSHDDLTFNALAMTHTTKHAVLSEHVKSAHRTFSLKMAMQLSFLSVVALDVAKVHNRVKAPSVTGILEFAKLRVDMFILLQAENEVASLSRKLSLLEDDYEKSQGSLKTANDRIHELTVSADESERSLLFLTYCDAEHCNLRKSCIVIMQTQL